MSYKVDKFDVTFKGKAVPVAIHTVTDGDETNYIVSIEDHENFEITKNTENQWKADKGAGISEELLKLIIEKHEGSKTN